MLIACAQSPARGVLKEDADLTKGLGVPDYQLVLCLGIPYITAITTTTISAMITTNIMNTV